METKPHPIRVDDEVWEAMNALPGKTLNDKLRAVHVDVIQPTTEPAAVGDSPALLEVLDLVRSMAAKVDDIAPKVDSTAKRIEELPEKEDVEFIVDVTMQRKIDERASSRGPAHPNAGGFNPASVPGVSRGYPVRETSAERVAREESEREQRARGRSSIGDDPDFCVDREFVQE